MQHCSELERWKSSAGAPSHACMHTVGCAHFDAIVGIISHIGIAQVCCSMRLDTAMV